jgi:hypothetical protein
VLIGAACYREVDTRPACGGTAPIGGHCGNGAHCGADADPGGRSPAQRLSREA